MLGDLRAPAVKVFQSTDVSISPGLGHHWEADCHAAFALRESSVQATRASATSESRSAEKKTPSQWNHGSLGRNGAGDCRSWRIGTSRF